MLLIPLLTPFVLLAFLLFMERVENVLLDRRTDEEEAARLQRVAEARRARATARPKERIRHGGNAGRLRASSASSRSEHTLRSGRLLDSRNRPVRRRAVRPGEVGPELDRKSA